MKIPAILVAVLFPAAIHALTVVDMEKIPLPDGVMAMTPVISPDGSFVVYNTGETLVRHEIGSGQEKTIAEVSAPYAVRISSDGNDIAWLDATYEGPKRYISSMTAKSDGSMQPSVMESRSRELSASTSKSHRKISTAPYAATRYGHLDIVYPDGTTTTIDPQGKGSYLWPQVSPDGRKVVYWLAGQGCFVAGIDGINPRAIGDIRATVWVGNDMLVGMHDIDDGRRIVSSDLRLSDLDGNMTVITPVSVIAVEPSASASGHRIVFSDASTCSLYLITLSEQ